MSDLRADVAKRPVMSPQALATGSDLTGEAGFPIHGLLGLLNRWPIQAFDPAVAKAVGYLVL